VDLADPGCSGPRDTTEFNRPPQCSNGQDDDGDGRIDLADPGCSGPRDTSEFNRPGGGGDGNGNLPNEFFGLARGGPLDIRDFRKMRQIEVKTLRLGLNWAATERKRGEYRWPDLLVAQLARNGIRPVFSIFGTPKWASGSRYQGVPPIRGYAKQSWKHFVEEAVRHYGREGTFWREHPDLKKKAVKSWQIWNEPNLAKYFAKEGAKPLRLVKNAPRKYAKVVQAADNAIHRVDMRANVILAGLTARSMFDGGKGTTKRRVVADKFLRKFLQVPGINKHFNAVGLHPYTPSLNKFKQAIKKTRKIMRRGGARKKDVWLTEMGWGSGKPNRFRTNKGLKGQAKILKKSFKLVVSKRKEWNIRGAYWFDWRDPTNDSAAAASCGFCGSAGLLKFDRTQKPSYKKFKQFTKRQR
jgi:hypothetical protein